MNQRLTTVESTSRASLAGTLSELWAYRGLIWAFSARDLKVKYFQTIFGPLWVLMTPLITVGVMTFVFGLMVKVPSDGLPYLLFYLVAIVPWYAFVNMFSLTTSSLEAHATLISKIYFPRLIIATSYGLNGAVDFLVGFAVSILFAAWFGRLSAAFVLVMPLMLLIQMAWALGLGLLLAPMNARFRDVKHMIPLAIQLYYFANPIMYPVSVAPEWARWIYAVNPLSVVVTTYRSTLADRPLDWPVILLALVISLAVLAAGALVFVRKGQEMVDAL